MKFFCCVEPVGQKDKNGALECVALREGEEWVLGIVWLNWRCFRVCLAVSEKPWYLPL